MSRVSQPRRWLLLQIALPAFGIAIIGFGWLCLFAHFETRRSAALEQTATNTGNLAVALEQETERTVKSVDQIMLFIIADYERDPAAFSLQRWLEHMPFLNPLSLQISLAGPTGGMLMSSLGPPDPSVTISDRDHFRVHAARNDVGLFISRPVVGRVSKKPSIQLSRRLNMPDGSFGGVLVVSLDPDYITQFLSTIDVGRDGTVILAGDDGYVKIRASHDAEQRPLSAVPLPNLSRELASARQGTYEAESRTDGIRRIYSFRKVDDLPLVVLVGQSVGEITEPVARDRHAGIELGAFLTVAFTLPLFWLVGELDRRRRSDVRLAAQHEDLERLNRDLAAAADNLRRVNADLQASEARLAEKTVILEATLEYMDQGIMVVDATSAIPICNSRAIEILDLPPEMMAEKPTLNDVLRYQMSTGEFDKSDPPFHTFVSGGGVLDRFQVYERERPNGRIIEVHSVPLPDGGIVRTYTDITERRAAERELRAAMEQATAASRTRSAFLATMSHEIRTPLNGVIGLASLLNHTALDDEQRSFVTTLLQSADHLLEMISDVLDFSKLDTENMKLEKTSFDSHGLIQAVGEMLRSRAAAKRVDLDIIVDKTIPECLVGDAARLRQVLINLAGNALKFTERGRVAIEAVGQPREDGQVDLTVTVTDTGIGIAKSAIPQLFQDFHQLDGSITRRYGGTGLGLAISRRLVRLMGGDITIDSILGLGSTFSFTVTLPVAESCVKVFPTESRVIPAGTGSDLQKVLAGRRILLVEDNATNQMVATTMLTKAGWLVDIAGNGLEAVEAVRSKAYDLVLMDMMMPVMDGLQATRAIRGLPHVGNLPILALTASAFAHDEEACRAAGMNGFVTKPFSVTKLVSAVSAIVESPGNRSASALPPAEFDPPLPFRPIDHATVAELKDAYGNEVTDFVAIFLKEAERRLARIAELVQLSDYRTIAIEAHTLKGSSLTFGCPTVGASAAKLEQAAVAQTAETAASFSDLRDIFHLTKPHLLACF